MQLQMKADAMLLKGRNTTISIIEYNGKTEVVVKGETNSICIENDDEGLHIGKSKPNRKCLEDTD